MKTEFTKIVAAGNDFLFFKSTEPLFRLISKDREEQRALISRVCDRHFGVGADGLVFVETVKSPDRYRWHFYNRDGSPAEMCGNAARAAGRFLNLNHSVKIETVAGEIVVQKAGDGQFSVLMPKSQSDRKPFLIEFDRVRYSGFWVDTGVPHFVVDLDSTPHKSAHLMASQALRRAPEFGLRGANVTWYWREDQEVCAVTYERGVEDFTLACGTGAVAAAIISGSEVIKMPGGRLKVGQDESTGRYLLTGQAQVTFQGTLEQEVYQ